jgi:hypothetical protein
VKMEGKARVIAQDTRNQEFQMAFKEERQGELVQYGDNALNGKRNGPQGEREGPLSCHGCGRVHEAEARV